MRAILARPLSYIDSAINADIPAKWSARQADNVIELEPPSGDAAVHISVLRRRTEKKPKAGQALALVRSFVMWNEAESANPPTEVWEGSELVAKGSCGEPGSRRRWDIAVRMGHRRLLIFSYTDDGSEDLARREAEILFSSIELDHDAR